MWDPSSLTRDQTHVLGILRQILNHWTTRDVPGIALLLLPCGGSSPDWRIWALGEHHSPSGSGALWLLCLTYKPSMSPGSLLHSANMYKCLLGARPCSQSRETPKSPWGRWAYADGAAYDNISWWKVLGRKRAENQARGQLWVLPTTGRLPQGLRPKEGEGKGKAEREAHQCKGPWAGSAYRMGHSQWRRKGMGLLGLGPGEEMSEARS